MFLNKMSLASLPSRDSIFTNLAVNGNLTVGKTLTVNQIVTGRITATEIISPTTVTPVRISFTPTSNWVIISNSSVLLPSNVAVISLQLEAKTPFPLPSVLDIVNVGYLSAAPNLDVDLVAYPLYFNRSMGTHIPSNDGSVNIFSFELDMNLISSFVLNCTYIAK
jgi:hypothetical protein